MRRSLSLLLLLVSSGCDTGHHVLAFTAKWCPVCQSDKQIIQSKNLDIDLIDVDAQPETARQYGVTSIPAYFIDGVRMQNLHAVQECLNH
jgi:glutaredoxin